MKIVGVSFSPVQLNAQFREKEAFLYPLWSDVKKELGLFYGATTSPSAFFADRITVLLDADGTWLLEYAPKGDLSAHPGEVLSDCAALFGG